LKNAVKDLLYHPIKLIAFHSVRITVNMVLARLQIFVNVMTIMEDLIAIKHAQLENSVNSAQRIVSVKMVHRVIHMMDSANA